MGKGRLTTEETLTRLAANWPEAARHPMPWLMIPLQRLLDLMQAEGRAAVRPFGLTGTALDVLAALRRNPPPHEMRPTELTGAVLISSGGLTKVLHDLTRRGLIERPAAREGDRRIRPVRLTDAGCDLAERAVAALHEAEGTLLARATLRRDELDHLAVQIRRLVAALEMAVQHAPRSTANAGRRRSGTASGV